MNLENKKLNEVLDYEQPTKYIVESTDYDDSFETPVLTAGKSFLLGYTDDKNGIFENVPAIIFDDFTTSFHYVDFPFKVKSSAMKILTPKEDFVDLKYIYQQMKQVSIDTQLHKRYWISKFSNETIPFPKSDFQTKTATTQQRITAILDDAAALRDKTAQLLKEYDLLAQSIFLEMFGDPVRNPKNFEKGRIRDLVVEAKYGTSSKAGDQGKYPYLRMNNITYSGYMNYDKLKYVDIKDQDIHKYLVKKGDLLFNRTNSKELVGKTAIFDSDTKMIAAGYLIRVRLNDSGNPFYVWGYLNSKHGKLVLNNMCKNIVGMANINAQELQNIKILLPPIELQTQFAEKIALIEQQKELAKQELKESEDLFNCLLQQAFKGELE